MSRRHGRWVRVMFLTGVGVMNASAGIAQQRTVVSERGDAERLMTAKALLARPVTVKLDHLSLRDAIRAISVSVRVQVQYDVKDLARYTAPVSLQAQQMPLAIVLERVLEATDLKVVTLPGGGVALTPGASLSAVSGIITGRVTDATTKRPVTGATVLVDDASRGVQTDDDGAFRIVNVASGTHRVTVRKLAYGKNSKTVEVAEGQSIGVDFALEPGTNVLDQVVVTGTVVQTELKAVPNAITVITAKQIEERGITRIDQLFRGDVPGLFVQNQGSAALLDQVTMFSRGATALSGSSAGVSGTFLSNPIKTYVDGVELADPQYLSQIDPKSIERIEILTGPQASTIYGSNAINGVMQIFTKRGTRNTPQLTLNLLSGWVENNFSSALTPQHDYSTQLSGIEGRFSYNSGGSWNYIGPWTPAKQTTRTNGFGGARLELPTAIGRVTTDVSFRRSITQSVKRGNAQQTYTGYREIGWYTNVSSSGLNAPGTSTLTGQTFGLTVSYTPVSWWSHELGIGQDASDLETRLTARGYLVVSDTTLSLSQSHTDRRSVRYATTTRIPIASIAQTIITAGADAWQNLTSSWDVSPQTLTGSLTGSTNVSRQPGHNAGGFLQSQFGIKDRFFVTYGLRVEWNPGYGKEAQPNYAPRYGVAYTQELGPLTAKLRGSYGRSTRPPQAGFSAARTAVDAFGSSWSYYSPYYAPFDWRLANPDLAPEHQQGGEGGLELYLSNRGSLVVTRYNQTFDGLIASTQVDSVRSVLPCNGLCFLSNSFDTSGYGYVRQFQYLNIGSIRNQGWELQGSLNAGPFITKGSYSWTKSRTIGVNPKYRAYFANQPQYQPGATFQYLPEHTWALGVTYAHGLSSIGLNVTGAGKATMFNNDFFLQGLSSNIRLLQNRLNVSNPNGYINFTAPYALADLTASHRISPRFEGVLQVQNLANRYTNDFFSAYASLGRQTKLGLRIR